MDGYVPLSILSHQTSHAPLLQHLIVIDRHVDVIFYYMHPLFAGYFHESRIQSYCSSLTQLPHLAHKAEVANYLVGTYFGISLKSLI